MSDATVTITLRVGSTMHASRVAKVLRDMRYTSLPIGKIDTAVGLQFIELLAGMTEMRTGNG